MQHATSWFETADGPSLALMAMVRRAGGSDFTGPSIRPVLSYLAHAGNARWRVLVSVSSQGREGGGGKLLNRDQFIYTGVTCNIKALTWSIDRSALREVYRQQKQHTRIRDAMSQSR